jgi:hypothetical protein
MVDLIYAYNMLKPLAIFILGLAIYSIIMYNFYRFVAKRDIFELNLRQYNKFEHPAFFKFFAALLYTVEYLLFFPFFLIVWFIVFAAIIISITNNSELQIVFLISMALISSIRILSYYKQTVSKEVAKILPFALLAIFLIDISAFNLENAFSLLKQIPSILNVLIYYLVFVILLEFILRIIYTIKKSIQEKKLN